MNVAYCADQLGEGFLDLLDGQFSMLEEVVVELVTCKQLEMVVTPERTHPSYQGSILRPTTQESRSR